MNTTPLKESLIGLTLLKLNPSLSIAEATSCFKAYFETEQLFVFDNLLILKIKTQNLKKINVCLNRLAFSKNAHTLYSFKDFEKFLKKSSFETFKIENISKAKNHEFFSKTIDLLKQKKICANMTNPSFSLNFDYPGFVGLKIWENLDSFEQRRAHLRPGLHPTSIHPKVARAMINLASPKKNVLDPFCGGGGLLLEGELINLKTTGIDLDAEMIVRAKKNLVKTKLHCMNALNWNKKVECVVSDVPYGLSSKLEGRLDELLESFLKKYSVLTKKIVLCTPSTLDFLKIVKKSNIWRIENSFELYVHKSLTRKIYVLILKS